MTGEIVPFGKYKGQPVEALAADTEYCEWLAAQPWFRQRYGNVYNILINYGSEPQDSPEHNQMQVAFLDDARCFALADLLYPNRKDTYDVLAAMNVMQASAMVKFFRDCLELETSTAQILNRTFENRGWDVTYEIEPASITTHRARLVPPLPACSCQCDHSACSETSECRGGENGNRWMCRHYDCKDRRGIDAIDHCNTSCHWHAKGPLTHNQRDWLKESEHFYQPNYSGTIRVELKPDLGDDYPAVLRQVTRYPYAPYSDRRCVLVRRAAFEHVTWDQVTQIFAASKVTLLKESDLKIPRPQ